MRHRVLVAGALVVLALGAVLARLFVLQVLEHEHFTTLSKNNRVRLEAVPPPRGLIFDRTGTPLTENRPSYVLEITPASVHDLEDTLARLRRIIEISDTDLKRFRRALRRSSPYQPVPLAFNLSDEEVAAFAVERHHFDGVEIDARLSRHYPLAGIAAHVIGYVGRIDERELARLDKSNYKGTTHIGKLGLERFYEDLLHGQVGYQQVEVNAQGRHLRVLERQPPIAGRDLVLALDAGLQAVAESAMGEHSGAVVAIDPQTGDVLAMVSTPNYDPNLFVNGISSRDYAALRDDPRQPLFNRPLSGQYPPGSTIKPEMALAGLHYQVTWAGKTMYAGPYYQLKNDPRKYRDWKKTGHGVVNMYKAVAQSCDVYFYDLAYRLGIDRIHAFLSHFGFGRKTGIDTTGERKGLLPSREWKRAVYHQPWFPGETLIVGIGQGYMLATPLQLAVATATIATRGKRMQPRLVRAIRDPATGEEFPLPPRQVDQVEVSNPLYWDQVIRAMEQVVQARNGTAYWHIGRGLRYRMAGKTGTAQVFSLGEDEEYEADKLHRKLRDHALFVAFAPVEHPRIAVAVIVEHAGHGGAEAAPVARKVIDYWLLRRLGLDKKLAGEK
ncbi:MAG: penicillin-binding protein 2 [Gammaproteobacteria bacterium]|nr:MAG: penicillin-binding protein 2 [Gammaproteobacteria bacterium]